jgi:hypothetical protein
MNKIKYSAIEVEILNHALNNYITKIDRKTPAKVIANSTFESFWQNEREQACLLIKKINMPSIQTRAQSSLHKEMERLTAYHDAIGSIDGGWREIQEIQKQLRLLESI